MNHNGFVYMWINTINGKRYVGSHWGHEDDGYIGSGVVFKKAIKKYGLDQFVRVILEWKIYNTDKELRDSEHFYLQKLKVVHKDTYYNLTDNAGCALRSLKSREKQSKTLTGRKQSRKTINKRMAKMQGKHHPQYKGVYITPNGSFCSSIEAAKHNNYSYRTILDKCKKNKDGWYFKPKEKVDE